MRKKASISFTRDDLLYSNINSAAENSSVLYMIESSTSSIIKTGTILNPANITFYSYKKVGDGNYNAYTGWFKIQESINGINWTDKYTSSSSGEISKTYTPTSSAKFIKCILYINSGMTNQGAIISIGVLENGSSVTVSSIKYATNRDGSTQPPDSSFGTDVPTTSKGDWLWIKTTYSDSSVAISKSYIGTDGEDGKSIYVKNSTKVDGTTTIVLSDGEQDSTITIVDGEDGEDGQPGQPGEDGTNSYIHIAWANSADGTQDFSTSVSTGKSYIGVYYDSTSADSTRPQDYNWSLIKGSDGGNTAVVYLYQRNSSTAVIDWTNVLTYDFTDRSLVSLPSGWYDRVPSGTDPLYITSAIAYSKTSTDNITYQDWSTPVILSENGEDGTPGSNGIDGKTSAIVYLYQRAASTPQVPSQNLTYTFSTGAVTGQGLGNWVQQVPSGNNPIYIISALAVSNNLQYTIPGGTTPNGGWTTPRILAENGKDGKTPYIQNDFWYIDGTSTGIKALGEDGSSIVWKGESSSAPANPELNWCYRNTSDNKVYIYNGTNWVIMTQDGANGLDGYNQATLNIYRRTSSTLSSSDVPTNTTYNFSTKQIVGSLGSWTREIPEGTEQCWVSSAVAVSRTSTSDTLAWSEPVIFVKDGQDGNPGLNHATINLYKRIANGTSVTKPSTTSTYKFSDGTLSINGSVVTDVNGWSRDIPSTNSNSNPCYITTASVISSDDEVTITADNWPTPVKLVENGQSATQYYTHIRYSANSDGSNYDVSPSSSRPYIGVYNGTEQSAPPYGNSGWKWSRYLGADGTSVTITSITYAVTTTETQPSTFPYTSAPEVPEGNWLWTKVLFSDNKTSITKTKSGISGHDGLNQASITLYQRAASAPSLPSSDVTYRFSDGKFKVGSSTSYTDSVGNWVKTLPSINSSHPEYVGWAISASAISSEAEDTIASSEWSGPNKIIENGLNQAIVRVYKRSATTPTTSDKPTSSMTYTFSTGALSPDNSNGWTKEIPQVDGNPCWVRSASVINTALTDTISTSDWGNAVKFVEDGQTGAHGINTATVYLYQRASSTPDVPSNELTYTFSTNSLSGTITNNWETDIDQLTGTNPIYMIAAMASSSSSTDTISSSDWTNPIIIAQNGSNGTSGYNRAVVTIYKRASSPSQATKPANVTYTFSSGAFTMPTGWSESIPASDGNPCYATTAIAISQNNTATLQWSDTTKIVEDGIDGVSINDVVNSYLATNLSTGVTKSTPGWTPTIQQITKDKPYLWNYETVLDENDNEISSTDPIIIGHFGVDGVDGIDGVDGNSITSIDEFYQTTRTTTNPGSTGWQKNTLVVPDATNKYLWNYQVIHYSKTADQGDSTKARIIGVYGDRGPQGYSPTIQNGMWYINGTSTGVKAEGDDGTGISSIELYSTSGKNKTYRITFDDNTTFDYTVTDGNDGNDAYTIILTNENHTFAGTNTTALSNSSTTSKVIAYKGTSQISCYAGASSSATSISTGTTGLSCSISNNNSTNVTLTFSATTSLTTQRGEVSIPITADGKTFNRTFSWSVAFVGKNGENAIIYNLDATPSSLIRSATGVLTPSSITFSSTKIEGTGSPSSYAGYYVVQEYNGSTWSTKYSPSTTNSSYSYSPTATAVLVKADLYSESSHTNLLDTQTVGIASNGKSISTITNYYLATDLSSGVTTSNPPSGHGTWSTDATTQIMSESMPYLWNYEIIKDSNNTTITTTTPTIIGKYGIDGTPGTPGSPGKGITGIVEHFLATDLDSGVTTSNPPSGHGTWTTTVQSPTEEFKYLWNYEVISYTTGDPYTSNPRIIGTYGRDGEDGKMLWGICSSTATTAAKVVACSDVTELYAGLTITVKFSAASSVNVPTLNVQSTGAKSIYVNNAVTSSTNKLIWAANAVMTFTYDGTNWLLVDQPISYAASCSTAAGTADKVVTIDGCVIRNGTSILCKFTNAHTASSASLTISSVSTGSITSNGSAITTSNSWAQNQTVLLTFNGSSWQAGIYTNDSALNTFLTQYATDQSTMQGLIEDSKLETYYTSSVPSASWTSSEKSKHEGDLWYYTGTTTSDYKQNATYRWDGTQWQQQNVPKEVFDQIDGKKDIHYTNNAPLVPPYNAGDLWSNGTDLRICINSKTTGQSYNISDWVLASNYIDSADATSIASTEANKTKTTETKTLYYISTSSSEPTGGSWVDETTITTADVLNKYLFVKIQNKINGSWVDATPSPGYQEANLYNGIYTFANTVAGDSGLTTINGSKITTGRIQDSTGKNFIQIASAGTTTAGHLEFKDASSWNNANQGIQWNSSQGQLNIKGHITAKSLTIDGTGGSYNAYDAINISGYSIEITMNDEGSSGTNPANNVWLYPHLYHNGVEVFYVLTSDIRPQTGKTYYSYNSTTNTYTAYSTAPQNPKSDNAYESIDYTKFHWYRNNSSSYETGDTYNSGRLLCVFTDKIKVTYTFDDGASDGGMTAMEVTVDDSKYITRIDNSSINIHPENTSGNSITLNSSGVNLASGKYLINGSDWAVALSDKYTRSSAGDLNWSSTTEGDAKVIAKSALAFWNGAYSGTSSNLSKCSTGNIIGSNGGTMTGQLKTSFKQSVAMGSYGSSQTTIEGLVGEVRYSSGCSGSASIGTAYTLSGVTIPTGWYNFSWMPHRSGGVNGAASGDNCNYGNLLLFGMNNTNGRFIIRVSSSEVQEVVRLITTAEFADYITTQGSNDTGWKWRIWYSGRIEAWCTHTWTNVACTTQLNSTDKLGYRSADVSLSLPSGLFSTIHSCQTTMKGSGGSGYAMALRTLCTTTTISQMFWNSTSATKDNCNVDYYVTGI